MNTSPNQSSATTTTKDKEKNYKELYDWGHIHGMVTFYGKDYGTEQMNVRIDILYDYIQSATKEARIAENKEVIQWIETGGKPEDYILRQFVKDAALARIAALQADKDSSTINNNEVSSDTD